MVKSAWNYSVVYVDDSKVTNEHLLVTKKEALKKISRALAKGYVVTAKKTQ